MEGMGITVAIITTINRKARVEANAMTDASSDYGLWGLVVLNSVIFIFFAFSFFLKAGSAIALASDILAESMKCRVLDAVEY